MGSPWPWPQEPVNTPNGSPLTTMNNNNNSNNNKRANYGYGYYHNLHNNDFHQSTIHQQQNHHVLHNNNQRFVSQSPPSPPVVAPADQIISGDNVTRKRTTNHHQQPFFPYDIQQPQLHQYHHQPVRNSNNNGSFRKPQSPSASSTTAQKSQFVTSVTKIPTWNIYYSDQKHRIIDFSKKNNSILPDPSINQLVSLCFVDTCITNLAVDAIVNSTTQDYRADSGVDKHIHEAAGRKLRETCRSLPRLGIGQAEMTPGFSLPAKYVIHTNGPLTEDAEQLKECYVNSLNLFLTSRLRTIAFPCISTGVGGKGLQRKFAVEIALSTIRQFLEEHKQDVDRVIFCLHHQKDAEIYLRYMQIYFPVEEQDLRIPIT